MPEGDAVEAVRSTLIELQYLLTPDGVDAAERAVYMYWITGKSWERGHPDGGSALRIAYEGGRHAHAILEEQIAHYRARNEPLPQQLYGYDRHLVTVGRTPWPSRDPALTHWRNLVIVAAVSVAEKHGLSAGRWREKIGTGPSASLIVSRVGKELRPLSWPAEKTIQEIFYAHHDKADPLEAARMVLSLVHTST